MVFQNRRPASQGRTKRSCVCQSTCYQKTEPINRLPAGYGLSALRLCVWLRDNCYIKIFHIDGRFLPAFRAKKWKVFEYSFCLHLNSGFVVADWA